mmetsp:Transcript_9537/g.14348  ORF Transcript_9537/g.14348 Transcript_9537/m.14348 type:complete len:296 (+) Transcript_9537:282-1169(+)
MEFDHVGAHCEAESCNQRDFLPFKCSYCSKNLCHSHRSPLAHGCTSAGAIDVTSMDCPICGKTIKMNKSDDPNEIWDQHFTTICSQQPKKEPTQVLRCASPSCSTALGPSNTITCTMCHRKVCITHRAPDHHRCGHLRQQDMLKSRQHMSQSRNAEKPKSTSVKNKKTSIPRPENTLMGTAKHRQQQAAPRIPTASTSASAEGVPPCHVCGAVVGSFEGLVEHVESLHPAPTPSPPPSTVPAQVQQEASSSGVEVCPQCQRRFSDVVDLIRHVERDHSSSNSILSTGNSDNCSLS